jgi:hypothetical protein
MKKFNLMWGIIGFVVGAAFWNIGMGVAFGFVFGILLFPQKS